MKKICLILMMLLFLVGCKKTNNEPLNVSGNQTPVTINASAESEVEVATSDESSEVIEVTDPIDVVVETEAIESLEEKVVMTVEETITSVGVNQEINHVQVAVESLEVRMNTSINSEVIASVYLGSVYAVVETELDENSQSWLMIKYDEDKTGWIPEWMCNKTNFNQVITVNEEYELLDIPFGVYEGTSINISDILGDTDYVLTVDGKEVVGNYEFSEVGIHEFVARKKDDGTEGVLYLTQVYGKSVYGLIYESYNIDSRVIGVIRNRIELTSSFSQVIMLYNNGVEIWYEIKLENNQIGYLYSSEYKSYDQSIDKVTCVVNNELIVTEGNRLHPMRDLYLDKYLKIDINWSGHKLINLENGNTFETDYSLYLLEDDESMLVFKDIYQGLYEDQTITELEIIDLSSDNFDVIFTGEKPFVYIETTYNDGTIEFFDDNTFNIGSLSINHWYYADNLVLKELCQLSKINGTWTLKVLESPLDNLVDEDITIYSEFLNLKSSIGEFKVSECDEIKFLRIYDIIDNAYVLWFEVTLNDGQKGYAYRHKRSYESTGMLSSIPIDLVLSDNSLEHIDGSFNHTSIYKVLDTGLEFVNQYMISSSYEGKWTDYISKDEGRFEKSDLDTYHYTSKDKSIVIRNSDSYYDPSVNFTIFNTTIGTLNEVFHFEQSGINFRKINIIDNETITLWIYDSTSSNFPVVMKFINNSWVLETDYVFD